MIGLNGYNFSSGVFPKYLHGDDIISLPLNVDEKMQVGTITHKDAVPTELGREFRRALEGYARRI